jgi:hypothetical protein
MISFPAARLVTRLRWLEESIVLFSHHEFGLAAAEGRHFAIGTAWVSILSFNPAHAVERDTGAMGPPCGLKTSTWRLPLWPAFCWRLC